MGHLREGTPSRCGGGYDQREIIAGRRSDFVTRVTQGGARWPLLIPNDFEMRFTAAGGMGLLYPSDDYGGVGKLVHVPFELWNIGNADNPNDDVRYFPFIIDNNDNGEWGLTPLDHLISGGDNDPYTDPVYWVIVLRRYIDSNRSSVFLRPPAWHDRH